jgi:hypothetical protein
MFVPWKWMLVTFVPIEPLQAGLVLVVAAPNAESLASVIFMLAMLSLMLDAVATGRLFVKWMMRLSPGLTMSVGASSPAFVT